MRSKLWKWKYERLSEIVIENLSHKGIDAEYLEESGLVVEALERIIDKGSTVAVGGSLTLQQTGVIDFLREYDCDFFDRYSTSDKQKLSEIFKSAFSADYFLASVNALTVKGEIVQLDGFGTRVAPMIFGPKKVVLIVGMNKIVADMDSALKRIKTIAPMNARRLKLHTPCVSTGVCMDCNSTERICESYAVIADSNARKNRYTVVLVGEDLGL